VTKFHLMTLAIVGGLFISCERQEFEGPNGTKQLNEPHGTHGGKAAHGETSGHGETAKEKDNQH
jgi:hypothetical protein